MFFQVLKITLVIYFRYANIIFFVEIKVKHLDLEISSEKLVDGLLQQTFVENIFLLDSCAVGYLESRFLIAGIKPLQTLELSHSDSQKTSDQLDEILERTNLFKFLTISYNFGLKIQNISSFEHLTKNIFEPDVFVSIFDSLIIYDYQTHKISLVGNETKFTDLQNIIQDFSVYEPTFYEIENLPQTKLSTNLTKSQYISKISEIKEEIRRGNTYQTNLTQQFRADLPETLNAQIIFRRLRTENPAPFSAFIQRKTSTVVSSSPERFFKISYETADLKSDSNYQNSNLIIETSPVKGTRPRGKTMSEDSKLQNELLNSEKDRAENLMIVDLLRNDLGRVCEFGTVSVEKLCQLEIHPTLVHLVSTVKGALKSGVKFSEILQAVFPCGSITGAPKISTMKIIESLENVPRNLSMGAIGFSFANVEFPAYDEMNSNLDRLFQTVCDFSVSIRTMTIAENQALFNVGGGIVIDSEPESEYDEMLTKAKALLNSLNSRSDY